MDIYFAEGYLGTNSEKMLGQALKDVRSKAIITSKYLLRTPADLMKEAIPAGIWEVILFIYNHMEGPAIEPLVTEAGKNGVGLIAMKVFAGGLELYGRMDPARKPAACLSYAGPCEAACPHGLAVRAKLVRAHKLLEA